MTTSQEVIQVLLSKYHIMDNPRKFALYEKTALPGNTGEDAFACVFQTVTSWYFSLCDYLK